MLRGGNYTEIYLVVVNYKDTPDPGHRGWFLRNLQYVLYSSTVYYFSLRAHFNNGETELLNG